MARERSWRAPPALGDDLAGTVCLTVKKRGRYAMSVGTRSLLPAGRLGGSGVHEGAERTDNSITTVERIFHDDLAGFYNREFEVVARHVRAFLNDEEYVQIYIVFDGKVEELRATNWAKGLTGRIRKKLSSEQIEEFPILSPVSKSEWPMIKRALPNEQTS